MTRRDLNRFERAVLDAESGKGMHDRVAHAGNAFICLKPRDLRELLEYVEWLERAVELAAGHAQDAHAEADLFSVIAK